MELVYPHKVTITVEKNLRSKLYTAKVDGKIIGDFTFKFTAKRAARKYIKNNFSEHQEVYSENVYVK